MSSENQVDNSASSKLDEEAMARRKFLKRAAMVGTAVPAAALLMTATAKPAFAQDPYYSPPL